MVVFRWGCGHENDAIEAYRLIAESKHSNLIITENGLFIDIENPYIGASPDGLLCCSCCGEGVLEVKCLLCVKEKFPDDEHNFCMTKQANGEWILKQDLYQIQTQMHVCRRNYCDFVIWSEKGILMDRVYIDSNFFDIIIDDLKHFFVYGILPEIVGKWYTRQPVANSDNIVPIPVLTNESNESDEEDYDKVWCYCSQPSYGEMIFCENESCSIQWFHCDCLRIRKIPKDSWRCPSCRRLPLILRYN